MPWADLIYGIPAFIILIVGVFGLIGKGVLGSYAKAILGAIPIFNAKLWAILFVVIGLSFGAIAGGRMAYDRVKGTITETATFGEVPSVEISGDMLDCEIATKSLTTALANGNATWRADKQDRQHYYLDLVNATSVLDDSINGTLSCTRSGSVIEGGAILCHVEGDSFRSEVSTTDSNTYYLFATGTSKSRLSGYTWAQTVYLNDNAVATTSSDQEQTYLTFDDNEAKEDLGFYLTLGGATNLNYLDEQSSLDARIVCNGVTQYTITATKISI